ncbi:hypothetical protein CWI80_06390 [Pseudidiomarina sediminum]|uniref:Porin n=1 Tax=Pseudidiomarina sediminum TaxID=431675 RepID=A0A432ZAL5_9GAMM|nr:hypothetical protein [Pseudidiomarina sediminum]RUO74951.1 hypothetical protein CWI80_06390 [Pseudidiomarina sediminum]
MTRINPLYLCALSVMAASVSTLSQANESPTRLSSQVFINFSNLQAQDQANANEGWQPDLKRFYLDLEHQLARDWQVKITTDVQWHRQQDPTDVWFRHAYLNYRIDDQQFLKLGVAELPWIDYIARRVGYRYIEPSLTPKNQLATPTDPGIHYGFRHQNFSVGAAVVTGTGFKQPRWVKQFDIELTGVWHLTPQIDVATSWYEGARGQDRDAKDKLHNAQRWNLALSYQSKATRVGIEYSYNDNWRQVAKVEEDASDGWSIWASHRFHPLYSAFVRYDITQPSRRLQPTLKRDYLQLGVDWQASKMLTIALVAKQNDVTEQWLEQTQTEVGIWTQWRF